MKAYINKIMSACHKRDILAVSYAATELRIWIAEEIATCEGNLVVNVDNFNLFEDIKVFYNQLKFPDLMKGISRVNFREIEKAAKELDFKLLEYCKNQKFKIPKFQYLEEVNNYCQR
ncbi:MAG: hypothetical protein ACFE9L_05740 [Candidatus Hodarchaeota archaeon]